MANQALIQAAQRMYSAKAAKAERDISPILQAGLYTTQNIKTAIEQKRENQKEEAAKGIESFKDILLKNDKIRPELTTKLESLQEQYFQNLKIAEGVFVGADKKRDAIEANNKIANQLRTYESQLRSVDLNKTMTTNTSKANYVGDQVDDVVYRDKSLADNLVFKDDGIYYINHKNEEVSLDDYKRPLQVFSEGITGMVNTLGVVQQAGSEGQDYEGAVEEAVENSINTYLRDSNYKSLFFDDIGTYNWAEQQLLDEFGENSGVELVDGKIKIIEGKEDLVASNLEELKKRVDQRPDFYKDEFKKDYKEAMSKAYQKALSKYEAKQQEIKNSRADKRNYQLSTTAQYVERDYIEDVYDQIKEGAVIVGENVYFKDKDGLFYKSTDPEKLVKEPDAKGMSDKTVAKLRGIDGYASEFGYEFAVKQDEQVSDEDEDIEETTLNIKPKQRSPISVGVKRILSDYFGADINIESSTWNQAEDGTWSVRLLDQTGRSTDFVGGITEQEILNVKKQNPKLSDEDALLKAAANKLQAQKDSNLKIEG